MAIFAQTALVGTRWAHDVRVEIQGGMIRKLTAGARAGAQDTVVGVLLPAPGNVHSHAFQRAFAGMAEFRARGRDSFWTWRRLMYRFLDVLRPEHVEAIAAQAYLEMLEAGFGAVGEFHYLHHQPGGTPYDDRAELGQRIVAAAATTGIGLTHLPVLYRRGGAGDAPLSDAQLRFANTVDEFLALVDATRAGHNVLHRDSRIGIAPHSLRAVSPGDLTRLLGATPRGPVHIHIAEQIGEIDDIVAEFGARPVAWLLDNAPVDGRWCLIHATHMTAHETRALAGSGAVAGLCPITEANLGDGIFNGVPYIENGGAFGVGSDSNIRISLVEELRLLEYSQRLRDRARNVMVVGQGSVGRTLYAGAARGGARALGRDAGEISVGKLADLLAIDRNAPALCALGDDQIIDGLVFAAGRDVITDVWSAGRHVVRGGRHVARDHVTAAYRRAIADLVDRI